MVEETGGQVHMNNPHYSDVHYNLTTEIISLAETCLDANEPRLSLLLLKIIEVYDRGLEIETATTVTILTSLYGEGAGNPYPDLHPRVLELINRVEKVLC